MNGNAQPSTNDPTNKVPAHQKAPVQIDTKTLKKFGICGRVFITGDALIAVDFDVDKALQWFKGPTESVTVGETKDIGNGLEALFGYDGSQPNALCFFVLITAIKTA